MDFKKIGTIVLAAAVGIVGWDSKVIYPLKLLVVLFHESGHAIAAKLVGGTIESITIDSLEGGLCTSRYEPTFFHNMIVSSAGYLGSAVSGALLLILAMRFRAGRWILGALAAGLLFVLAFWARSPFTIGVTLGMAIALGLAAKYLPPELAQLTSIFIAVFTLLYALFDLRDDLWSAERRAGTDAAILASQTYIPSIVWAVLWSSVAVALLGLALWLSAKGRRSGEKAAAAKLKPT